MSIVAIARAEIRALDPYSSARMEASGGSVLLNANESPWSASHRCAAGLNRYPDPQPQELVARFAALYGVDPAQVLAGRGSDEAIDLLVRAFCRAGRDAIAICPPTFGMYAVSARIQDAGVVEVRLTHDFNVDVDALLAAINARTKLVFLCSPNNPTGGAVPLSAIKRIAGALSDRALLVVDEAYVEFAGELSALSLLPQFANLAVLRTLSKAHALAGARVGTLIARAEVIALLRRIQAPYPLPVPSIAVALEALSPPAQRETAARIAMLVCERERLAPLLAALPQVRSVLPSAANFLCVRCIDAKATYARLREAGIVVRDVGGYPGLTDCLRISIGAPDENTRLLASLQAREAAA
ncbi:MAG: histidinol-phosphate transaminase [Rudaea sp.]|nr:histidinol-phosphate transaminase [Rudaea sp.]